MQIDLEEGSRAKKVNQVILGASGQLLSQGEDYSREVTYTSILQAAGEFGTFQRRLVALIFIPNILSAFFMFDGLLMLKTQPHHCNTSWLLAIQPNLTTTELLNLTLPRKADGSFEECRMYSPVQWDFDSIVKYGLNDTEDCQNGWIYLPHREWSLITEFNLVCNKASEPLRAHSLFMTGLFFGSLIIGTLCDRIGHYKTILIMLMLYSVFGFGMAFVPNFNIYKIFQFGIGVAIMGYTISSVSLATEWLVTSRRVHAIVLAHCFFVLGLLILSALAYSIPHWRMLYLARGLPVFFLVSYIRILPESPLWLLLRGRTEKAKSVLCKAASINKKVIPPELLHQLTSEKMPYGTVLDILQTPHLRKIAMILSYVWFSIGFGYIGLSTQLQKLAMNVYGCQVAFRLVELPACLCCLIMVEKLGRRRSHAFTLLLGGFTCLLNAFLPDDLHSITITLAMLSQIGLSASVAVSYIHSAELFPVGLRQVGLSFVCLTYSIGAICTPLVEALDREEPETFMTLCGIVTTFGGFLCFLLPKI